MRHSKKSQKKTMDIILVLVGITTLVFTITMIWLYLTTGGIPDTLCTCFFVACTGECGFMGWIKAAKVRYQEHEWQLQEITRQQKAMQESMKEYHP
jgi:predicted permease